MGDGMEHVPRSGIRHGTSTDQHRGGRHMWCALHVKSGSEAAVEAFLSRLFSKKVNARCFHLTRYRRKKYGGEWRTAQENLLPGYVIIETDWPEAVHQELKKTPKQGLIFSNDEFVFTLEKHETDFMKCIMDEDGEIGLSKVQVESDGKIRCISGPLLKVCHLIKKIDLHKTIAEVGKKHLMYLGIEIVGVHPIRNGRAISLCTDRHG